MAVGRGVVVLGAVAALLAACTAATDQTDDVDDEGEALSAGVITPHAVSTTAQIPSKPPARGSDRVHLIDVGTGLSILVQGHDFTMLYDGGSSDDSRGITSTAAKSGNESRLLAYLFAAVGPSGGPECTPRGDKWPAGKSYPERTIDHLVLSHAHRDHISMLGDVLHCYRVANVWEPGAAYDQAGYREFIAAVAAERGVRYHTAAAPPSPLPATWMGARIPRDFTWTTYAENTVVRLGSGAKFKVLHVDPHAPLSEANNSSLVLKVTLRKRTLLLMGDAQGGGRLAPESSCTSVEKEILAAHRSELDADIFQIGHHGSATSSRREFLEAVFPQTSAKKQRWALLSVGPTPYTGVVLPDKSVISEITGFRPGLTILSTNTHDRIGGPGHPGSCPVADRVGVDDAAPGGCDNFILDIAP